MKLFKYLLAWTQYGLDWLFQPWHRIRYLERQLAESESVTKTGFLADGTEINMDVSGGAAQKLAGLWVDFFHHNGGKNFVTMEVHLRDPWWQSKGRPRYRYLLTIQRVDGESLVEQLTRLREEIRQLKARTDSP